MPIKKQAALMLALLLLLLTSCTAKVEEETLTDPYPPYELPIINKPNEDLLVIPLPSDGMLRDTEQYLIGSLLVVEPKYETQVYRRGDVVYYKTPADNLAFDMARIIGLPGEVIRIRQSKIYIDGMRLDAFYGQESFGLQGAKSPDPINMELTLPEEHYFLLGDLWWRSFYSSIVQGPVSESAIQGQVVAWTGRNQISTVHPQR
ncbi:signal peptidase I [Paenibacillus gorillae]|uniref:signal peptidase I n=1 Tax=Paenibacillus gorillae TaxID=1243662 RepID=UPI0004B0EF98|nr:signal peptidase I [Paenibacillus gorillae]